MVHRKIDYVPWMKHLCVVWVKVDWPLRIIFVETMGRFWWTVKQGPGVKPCHWKSLGFIGTRDSQGMIQGSSLVSLVILPATPSNPSIPCVFNAPVSQRLASYCFLIVLSIEQYNFATLMMTHALSQLRSPWLDIIILGGANIITSPLFLSYAYHHFTKQFG